MRAALGLRPDHPRQEHDSPRLGWLTATETRLYANLILRNETSGFTDASIKEIVVQGAPWETIIPSITPSQNIFYDGNQPVLRLGRLWNTDDGPKNIPLTLTNDCERLAEYQLADYPNAIPNTQQ
jgi:hypothetical protein